MNEKLKQIIQESLPQSVGKELQEVLAEGDENRRRVKELKDKVVTLEKDLFLLREGYAQNLKKIDELLALNVRKEDLDKREMKFELEIAQVKLKSSEDKSASIHYLAETVFKNPRMTYSSTWNKNEPALQPGGYMGTAHAYGDSTQSAEETK